MRTSIKQLKSGKWGLFIGDSLIGVALTETRIRAAQQLVDDAIDESHADGEKSGYDDGYSDGYDDGYSNGLADGE